MVVVQTCEAGATLAPIPPCFEVNKGATLWNNYANVVVLQSVEKHVIVEWKLYWTLFLTLVTAELLLLDIFVNCNWVNTRWQCYSTHNQYIEQHHNNRTTQITAQPNNNRKTIAQHNDNYFWRVRTVPRLVSLTLAFALQLRKKHGKTSALSENEYQEHSWGKRRPVCENDNLATFMCRMSWKYGSLNLLERSGPHRVCYEYPLPLPFWYAHF